jgi:hypothetical protein
LVLIKTQAVNIAFVCSVQAEGVHCNPKGFHESKMIPSGLAVFLIGALLAMQGTAQGVL